jgi:hypothetical protein
LKSKLLEFEGKNGKDSPVEPKMSGVSSSIQSVKLNPDHNILIRMKKFYQGLYVKVAKTLPKGESSKKNTLEEMAKRLQSTQLMNGISQKEIVLYLGSVIYPSKAFFKNEMIFKTVDLDEEHTTKEKVKGLILLFHD